MDDEIPENFFISEEYKEFTEDIGGIQQKFYALPAASTDYDLTGQVLWPGAKHLALYIRDHQELIKDKIILEVGSGSGLCGLFCSHYASKTILTDGNDIVMRLLDLNKSFGKNVEIAWVEWSDSDPGKDLRIKGLPERYEVVVGTDVVYWSNSIVPLFKTMDSLLEDRGRFIMCYTLRAMNTYRDLLRLSAECGYRNKVLWNEESTYIFEFDRQ
ncbi:hypothetical protein SteCoe_33637 [Stentor coeruleus]|uniref:Uncharacterized protein n=1 Tax=Stentor coeruleus TaxID=5963 RepID=A0A1R2AWB9_9CILI|nr:hypothetical protein SteCoe_33637 [Stentor coeruleus]